jgi:hypothetical protein
MRRTICFGRARRAAFVLAPCAVLLVDFLLHPVFFESHRNVREVGVVALLKQEDVALGTFRGHEIHVSMDSISYPKYLSRLKTDNNALVVSVYVDEDGTIVEASLLRAILSKLQAISPQDFQDVTDALSANNAIHLHLLVPFVLHIEGRNQRTLPLGYLLLVPLQWSKPDESKKELAIVLPQVFSFATERRITTIILPCLGSNWENKNETSFDDFFSAFFNSVPTGTVPREVYLSFYTEWPSFYLETAVSALNASWRSSFEKEYQFPGAYRREFREIFLFLSLCLFVTSFSVRATFKNFCIISLSFCGAALGAKGVIDLLAQGQGPAGAWLVELVTFAVLAIGFRYFVMWDPKNLFK